jgi:hypothetical protein
MSPETLTKKVKFLVNGRGRRTHAVLPLKEYEELLEDLHGLAVVASRNEEGSISLDELKKRVQNKK